MLHATLFSKLFPVTLFACCLCLLSAFSANASVESDKPTILASIQPLGLIAKAIVGDDAHVEVLLPKGASAHHYALSVKDRRHLADADIVLWVGKELESFLSKPIQQRQRSNKYQYTVTAMELAGIHWPEARLSTHSGDHHGHDHGDRNPHLWLNPINYWPIIDALRKHLSQALPSHQQQIENNAQQLKGALQQLDAGLLQSMKPFSGQSFIAAHPAYDHFVERYGLQQLAYIALTPERQAGAKHLYQLRQLRSASCVVVDKGFPSMIAEQLSKTLDIPTIVLDPLGYDTESRLMGMTAAVARQQSIALIENLADQFRRCLINGG